MLQPPLNRPRLSPQRQHLEVKDNVLILKGSPAPPGPQAGDPQPAALKVSFFFYHCHGVRQQLRCLSQILDCQTVIRKENDKYPMVTLEETEIQVNLPTKQTQPHRENRPGTLRERWAREKGLGAWG